MTAPEVSSTTDTYGHPHVTVAYPFARTVGCSCGWVRRNIDVSIMDELAEQHLDHVAGRDEGR